MVDRERMKKEATKVRPLLAYSPHIAVVTVPIQLVNPTKPAL